MGAGRDLYASDVHAPDHRLLTVTDVGGPVASALLLDLDRTLLDVEPYVDYCAALAELRRLFPDEAVSSVDRAWGSCTRTAMAILAARAGDPAWPTASAVVERYELAGVERCRPMPGLDVFLARIDPSRTAIVTLLTERAALRALERHGAPRPAVVVGRSAERRPKPAPDPILAALGVLGAEPSEAVMVGDSEVDEAAARSAGVRFVGLTNGRASHGFGPGTVVVGDLLEAAARLAALGLVRAAPSGAGAPPSVAGPAPSGAVAPPPGAGAPPPGAGAPRPGAGAPRPGAGAPPTGTGDDEEANHRPTRGVTC